MKKTIACLCLSCAAFTSEPSHTIDAQIQIFCPSSEEFDQFVNSIPPIDSSPCSFDEWRSSFVNNVGRLIRLVESEKICSSKWSVKTDCKSSERPANAFDIANAYIDCCCFSLSSDQFEALLDNEVTLFHQTNSDPSIMAKGKKEVSELFEKYVFGNSSNIQLRGHEVRYEEGGVHLKIAVEEDKSDGRFHFKEETVLQLSKTNPPTITSISMKVKKTQEF